MRKLALVITLFGPFMTGCESDFDKCFSAEALKLENAHKAPYHPVIQAINAVEALGDERVKTYLLEWNRFEVESSESKAIKVCREGKKTWWVECEKERNALDVARESHLDELKLLDVEEVLDEFAEHSSDVAYNEDTLAAQVKQQVDAWLEGLNVDMESLSASEMAEIDLAYYKQSFKAWTEALSRVVDFSEAARETCNARGLYQ